MRNLFFNIIIFRIKCMVISACDLHKEKVHLFVYDIIPTQSNRPLGLFT